MKLYGKYHNHNKIGDFPNCTFLLENGCIYNIIVDLAPINSYSYPIKNKKDFEFEKLPSEKGLVSSSANYVIEYVGKSDTPQKIYLNLNAFQVFKIKLQLKKYLLQDKSIKLDIIKALIGIFISISSFFIGRYYEKKITSKPTSVSEQSINIRKSSENKIFSENIKNDSTTIK